MLTDELKKVVANKENFWNAGIILFCPVNKVFYKIAFGDGSDDEPIEGCDDYMYITLDKYDEYGSMEEDIDGGNMWFKRKGHNGKINDEKLIRDCLDFVECPDNDSCIFISQTN